MSVTVKGPGLSEIERAVRDLVKRQVLVGVPAEGATRPPEKGEASPPNNAQIGYWNEYGVPEHNIPARPHLLPGVESVQGQVSDRFRRAGEAALTGQDALVDQQLHAAGLIAQNAVRAMVTDGAFAPLSEVTLKRRKARGRTGEKPLIDTGQYRRSLTYVVRNKGQ